MVKVRVLCVGDSLTEGLVTWGLFHPYTSRLKEKLEEWKQNKDIEFEILNFGVSGSSVDRDMIHRVTEIIVGKSEEIQDKEMIIFSVVLGGTNDLYRDQPEHIAEVLKKMHTKILEDYNSNHSIAVTIPPMSAEKSYPNIKKARDEINNRLTKFVEEKKPKMSLLDLSTETTDKPTLWNSDGIHMSPDGYDFFGELVFESLKKQLELIEFPLKTV
eukprot:c19962_g1_i1.p1 GENE.c19962_g1_i1~~c19962_g1_i1.p1  ORF type:complete len:215 (+),score=84.00 c19962_g1_i1:50-694(+)